MEAIHSELNMRRIAGKASKQALIESDFPLGRDAKQILYAQGLMSPKQSRCEAGRVVAEGDLTLNLLCLGADNNPFGLQAATQFSHVIELAEADESMQAILTPRLIELNCSLNQGKVHLEAAADISCFVIDESAIKPLTDIAGVTEPQKLYAELETGELKQIGKEKKQIHEVIVAPKAEQILLFNHKAHISNITYTETEANVQALIYLSCLYLDGEGAYTQLNEQIPFQETVQLSADPRGLNNISADVEIEDMLVTLGADPGTLEIDAGLIFMLEGIANTRQNTLADAYVPDEGLACVVENVQRLSSIGTVRRVCTYSEGIKIPDNQPEAFRAIYSGARPTILSLKDDNGQLGVDGILMCSVVYQTDDGTVVGFDEDLPFSCTLDAPYLPNSGVSAQLLETRASGGGRIVNVSFTLEISAKLRTVESANLAMDIEQIPLTPRENGILIYYAAQGESFFSVGKKFSLPVKKIKQYNESLMEPFEDGCPILLLSASGRRRE